MNETRTDPSAIQQWLSRELLRIRTRLESHRDGVPQPAPDDAGNGAEPQPLDRLCNLFGLTAFEREIVLLCAAIELDGSFPLLCAAAQGDPAKTYPTFSLALAAFDAPHWSALLPAAPLRRWELITAPFERGLTSSPLRIDERILHYLLGLQYLDVESQQAVRPLFEEDAVAEFRQLYVRETATLLTGKRPIVLCGRDRRELRGIASLASLEAGLAPFLITSLAIAAPTFDQTQFLKRWEREAILSNCALMIELADGATSLPSSIAAIAEACEAAWCPLIVSVRDRSELRLDSAAYIEVGPPSAIEQKALWEQSASKVDLPLNGRLAPLLAQFSLSSSQIHRAMTEAVELQHRQSNVERSPDSIAESIWDSCRYHTRPHLEGLAQRIDSQVDWDDLVLPEMQTESLRMICAQVRQRFAVYHEWGFARKHKRGLGISVLFAGPSGTGKTLAAEILARAMRLDLYRIDLSTVVSKYIGETEKNLRRLFDAAEGSGCVLLFDESDALFGKRAEVRDSHDRFANIEISYLLQRMETYDGLAILTTNMKSALDAAFLRRIRMIVQFPFPEAREREQIWRRVIPAEAPTGELDYPRLARLSITGGSIRNIALNGAALAADRGSPIQMKDLVHAARMEYFKLERQFTEIEAVRLPEVV